MAEAEVNIEEWRRPGSKWYDRKPFTTSHNLGRPGLIEFAEGTGFRALPAPESETSPKVRLSELAPRWNALRPSEH